MVDNIFYTTLVYSSTVHGHCTHRERKWMCTVKLFLNCYIHVGFLKVYEKTKVY